LFLSPEIASRSIAAGSLLPSLRFSGNQD